MSVLGIIGIIIALFLLIYLGYKGWDVAYVAIIAVIVIAVFNAQNITETFVNTFMQGASGILMNLYPIFITGAIFGAVFGCSGAGDSIASAITKVLVKDDLSGKKGPWVVTLVCSIVFSILNYTGVDAMIGLFAMYPIIVGLMRKADLPRRGIPVLLMACYGIANGPGAVQSKQVLAMNLLGTESTAGLIPGIVAMVLVLVLSIPYTARFLIKCKNRGEGFTEFEGGIHFSGQKEVSKPNFFVALIPLVVIFVLFNFVKMNNAIAVLAGTVVALVIFIPQIKANAPEGDVLQFLKAALNKGVVNSSKITIAVISVVGFGSAVAATDTFMSFAKKLTSVTSGGYFVFAIAICVLVGLIANSIGGIQIGLPILGQPFIASGLSAAGIHRIALFAASTFDSLPISMFVIMCHDLSGVSLKDGYKPVFVVSVIVPLICTAVIALMYTIYPGWV
ncbi:MAG: GntP family permease [Lachnospiraceae bacterium]|nr:GntP family permease [Lachnospiraceae bacterium]